MAIDRLYDIAGETTRANSGIVHAGYDPEPGSIMARLNVRGSKLIRELCVKLDVPYKQNGSLVIGFNDTDKATIEKLYRRGLANKVHGLEIISGDDARVLEPNLSPDVLCALNVPGGGIVSPWELAVALAETAKRNGVVFMLGTEVTGITKVEGRYLAATSTGNIKARVVVNAAGLHADTVHGFLKEPDFSITPNKGQYFLLDKSAGDLVSRTIFQCPNEFGKGILVTPTIHGNLLIGPSRENVECRENVDTDVNMLNNVLQTARRSIPGLNIRENIRNFAGIRAVTDCDDFIIRETEKGFYDLAGIKSPGLTAAPAIAEELIRMMKEPDKAGRSFSDSSNLELIPKDTYIDERKVSRFRYMGAKQRAVKIRKNPAYGSIACRCENITEGEIIDAFDSPLPPTTLDAVKRRCHAGMGRCQGGFCAPKIISLIAGNFGIAPQDVLKDREGSNIVIGEKRKI